MSSLEKSLEMLSRRHSEIQDEEEIPQELFDRVKDLQTKIEKIERQINNI